MSQTHKTDQTINEAEKAVDARQGAVELSNQSTKIPQQLATPIQRLVLLFTGSFNPVTIAHLRLLELARDHYHSQSIQILEGIISPVSDSYGKPGLASIDLRMEMLRASINEHSWIRIDPWEASQTSWTRTRVVLEHHHEEVKKKFGESTGIRLLTGADVVRTMLNPKIWLPEDIETIMTRYGVACITRLSAPESGPAGPTIPDVKEGMPQLWKENIDVIQDWVINDISATNIRKQLASGRSVKYIVPDGAIDVIYRHGLYNSSQVPCLADWPNKKSSS